jgi:pimeloyl-ACP methyl ester carboxylesterase
MMTVHPRVAQPVGHPQELREVYHRMLRAADARGRFVRRASGPRVHVIDMGRGEGVVHLHGTNTSALSHLMLAERMRATRSYLVDRPGCGLSDPTEFTPGAFRDHAVRFVDEVLDALELDSATLVGASGGGIWATWYALTRPERVRLLVMLGSVPALPGVRVPLPLRLTVTPVVGAVLARGVKPSRSMLLQLMSSMGEADTIVQHPDLLYSLVAGARDPVAIGANLDEMRALMSPFGWRKHMRLTPQELRRLTVPTLMIWGDHDPVVSVEHARAAATLIPNAQLEVVPAGHVPQLGNPDRVAELLERFVSVEAGTT